MVCGSPFRDCLFKKLKVMREILIRAKRVDNGEFVYGYVFPVIINEAERWFIIPCDTFCPKDITIGELQVEVIPETVGQFTGLTDKNGVKVFEGDEVLVMGGLEYAVKFIDFEWCISNGKICYGFDQLKSEQTEVIGNIHTA